MALGTVLASRIELDQGAPRWTRVRIARTQVQPRLVRVVERWEMDGGGQGMRCLSREMFLADQLIVQVAPGISEPELRQRIESAGMRLEAAVGVRVFTVRLPHSSLNAVPDALRFFSNHPELVESAEPDGVGFGSGTPDDPRFSDQWGFHNIGQSGGTVDADVDAPEFWDVIGGAPGILIAVLDSGLNFTHPDLQGIAWVNPGEIPADGIDNDANGKVDDAKGWDFVNADNDPTDDHGHGSNVTGVIAANRNNTQGVAGMLAGARILVCKILNSSNSGTTANLIAAVTYARLFGAPVMNLSLQNYPYSSILNTEFNACQSEGVVLSICAGNQGANNDTTPNYPSCYAQTNIIAVGNHSRDDIRWTSSNYGLTNVDLFAPGASILSPVLGTNYSYYTGTSQATPFVTAVCASIKYANSLWTAPEIRNAVLSSVVPRSSYDGICVTGGRLNAFDSLTYAIRQAPDQDSDLDGSPNLFEYLTGTHVDNTTNRPSVFFNIDGGLLRLRVTRVIRPDAHLAIEVSPDLTTWTNAGVIDFSTTNLLFGGISISGARRAFLRISAFPSP